MNFKRKVLLFNKLLAAQPMTQTDDGEPLEPEEKKASFGQMADLVKGRATKYERRVPTGDPRRPWRYIYRDEKRGRRRSKKAEEHAVSVGAKQLDMFVDQPPKEPVELSWRSGHGDSTGKGARILSLFSGIGGLDLGLARALPDAKHVGMVENHKPAQKVLQRHFEGVHVHDDVRDVAEAALEGRFRDKPNVVVGGFPCTDVSVAGKRRGLKGERSGLYYQMKTIIEGTDPDWVVYENVPGLRSKGLDVVLADLVEMGYEGAYDGVPASAVGAPHLRDRIFVIGHRPGVGFEFTTPELQHHHWNLGPPVIQEPKRTKIDAEKLRGAGNAVSPAVAEHIGRLMANSSDEQKPVDGKKIAELVDGRWVSDAGEYVTKFPRAAVIRGNALFEVPPKAPASKQLIPREGDRVWIRNPDPNKVHAPTADLIKLPKLEQDVLAEITIGGHDTNDPEGTDYEPYFERWNDESTEHVNFGDRKPKDVLDGLVDRGFLNPDYSLTWFGRVIASNRMYGEQTYRRDRGGANHENDATVVAVNDKEQLVVVSLAAGAPLVVPMAWVKRYPTVGATEGRGGFRYDPDAEEKEIGHPENDPMHAARKRGGQLRHWVNGGVSSDFASWLMGFPPGWSDTEGASMVRKSITYFSVVYSAILKSATAPKGYMPIPGGKKGGYRKRVGNKWDYWYPDGQLDLFSKKPTKKPTYNIARAVEAFIETNGGWEAAEEYLSDPSTRKRAEKIWGEKTFSDEHPGKRGSLMADEDKHIPMMVLFDAAVAEYHERKRIAKLSGKETADALAERDPKTLDRTYGKIDIEIAKDLAQRMGQPGGAGVLRADFTDQERQILDAVSFLTNGNVATVRNPDNWEESYFSQGPEGGYQTVDGVRLGEARPAIPEYGEVDSDEWRDFEGTYSRWTQYKTPPGSKEVYEDAHLVMKQLAQAPVENAPQMYRGMGIERDKLPEAGEHFELSDIASFSSVDRNAISYARQTAGIFSTNESNMETRYHPTYGYGHPPEGYDPENIPGHVKVPVLMKIKPKRGMSIQTMSRYAEEAEFVTGGRVAVVSAGWAPMSETGPPWNRTKAWVVEVEHV